MVITQFAIEWFAGINFIILLSQIPVLPRRVTNILSPNQRNYELMHWPIHDNMILVA